MCSCFIVPLLNISVSANYDLCYTGVPKVRAQQNIIILFRYHHCARLLTGTEYIQMFVGYQFFKFKKCLLTYNTWYSNLNNRPQCVIEIKETDKRRKKAGRWHISRYIKYISWKTENERISISGSTLNQVWHIWVSLQLNNYASQRGLETLIGLCAPCMFQRY